jgi:hypothetical protein
MCGAQAKKSTQVDDPDASEPMVRTGRFKVNGSHSSDESVIFQLKEERLPCADA